MTKKIDRTFAIRCLRLIFLVIILCHYFCHLTNLFDYLKREVRPRAKHSFLFVLPGSATGECYASDFLTFYSGGLLNKERLEKHLNTDVYNSFLQTQTMERVMAPMLPVGTYSIQYPPIFFTLITPLAYFDLYTAWRLWFFALALCVVITYLLIAYKSLDGRPLLFIGLFVCFTSYPVSQNFFIGQSSAIEAVFIALAFRFLIDRKYFWAGFVAALSLLKLQQSLIILIPGFCIGKNNFLRGLILMIAIECFISILIVGFDNIWHFIRVNYVSEIVHSISDVDDMWYYFTFTGMLQCLPWYISTARDIGHAAYLLACVVSVGLWLKVYPVLQTVSGQAIQLIASISTVLLVVFSIHGCWYDYFLFVFPCLWLYIWSTSNDSTYSSLQSIARLIVSLTVFMVPFLFWDSLVIKFTENTLTGHQLRYFGISMTLLACAVAALFLEFKKPSKNVSSSN